MGEKIPFGLKLLFSSHISYRKFLLNILYWTHKLQGYEENLCHFVCKFKSFILCLTRIFYYFSWAWLLLYLKCMFHLFLKKIIWCIVLGYSDSVCHTIKQNFLQNMDIPQCEGLTCELVRLHSWKVGNYLSEML